MSYYFFNFFFNLSSDVILVKEHGCIYGWTNGTKSDNAISIQTMATQNEMVIFDFMCKIFHLIPFQQKP